MPPEDRNFGIDDEGPLDPEIEAMRRSFHKTAEPVRVPKRLSQWSGERLWSETAIEPMTLEDIEGERGVEGVYNRSLIPIEMISAIREGMLARYQHSLRSAGGYRGGMLHEFRVQPLCRTNPHVSLPSVCEQIRTDLAAAMKRQTREEKELEGVRPVYEGRVLVPTEGERRVLAWATWSRSRVKRVTDRRDLHEEQLRKILGTPFKIIAGVDDKSLIEQARTTVLFDTLNADPDVPGGASLLFDHLCSEWTEQGFNRVLLWRHNMLRMVDLIEAAGERPRWNVKGVPVPYGNNDASQAFFGRRGFGDIGTRLSGVVAPRDYQRGEKTYRGYVLSTEGWMAADLQHTAELSHELDAAARKSFGGSDRD